jgi:lysine-N-methylase
MAPPIKTLPILERWQCAGCARCCRGSIIHLDKDDLQRLRGQAWDKHPEYRQQQVFVRESWWGGSYRLAQREDGSCVFLTKDGRCRIHAEFGAEAKPLSCRMFPLQLVPRENGAVLTLRRACPTAAADQGPELKDYLSFARQVAEAGQLLNPSSQPPVIFGRHRRSWSDFLIVARRIELLLADGRFPLVRRVVHGLRFCAMLEQCNLTGFEGNRLAELCELIGENSTEVGDLFRKRIAPSQAAMTLFRQAGAECLRLHPTFVPSQSWRERWRMARAAVAFVRGTGRIPRLHPGLPETTFEDLERSLGHLDEPVQRPINRFFETHAASLQYALVGRAGWTLTQSYRALALSYPVGMWLLRICCTGRAPTPSDTIDMVTIMDRAQGYAPLMARNHRSRIAILARMGQLERLAMWYAR